MTPADYIAFVRPTCQEIEAGTGIDWFALAIQYANETAFGSAVYGNNLGNIRCSPTSFCQYASLSDYAQAAIAVWHQTAYINSKYPNGFEPFRAQAAAGGNTDAALAAIVASPWSGANYGGSLQGFYAQLEAYELTADEHAKLEWLYTTVGQMYYAGPAPNNWPNWSALAADVATIKAQTAGGGGGTQPPEPAEPTKGTLHVPAQDIPISFP